MKNLTNPIQQIVIGIDTNGNKIAKIKTPDGSFSIQTNDNMPKTHRDGVYTWSANEAYEYVKRCGTERQKRICTQELI